MTDESLTPDDLQAFMQERGVSGKILYLDSATQTVAAAAQAVGSLPERIVKSILFEVDGKLVLTVTCGQAHVDRRAIANLYGVGRKKVKLALPTDAFQETGYQVGAMPPFGHRFSLTTLLDWRVLKQPEIFAGGGAENALVQLKPQDILNTTNAKVMDLINPPIAET